MRALSPLDEMFLVLERRNQPMHVAALYVVEPGEGDGRAFARALHAHLSQFKQPESPFDERWVLTPLGYCWVHDDDFDLENHLHLSALPSPGGQAELDHWVAGQHETPLHTDRPPWEVHIVEGLADGRVAVFAKAHHALLDGVSGLKATLAMCSEQPDAPSQRPIWAQSRVPSRRGEGTSRTALGRVTRDLWQSAKDELAALPTLAREAGRIVGDVTRHLRKSVTEPASHPFAGPISSARRVGTLSLPLARVRATSKRLHATLNDVVLAVCSSALREHFLSRQVSCDPPLVAMVPVSLRHGETGHGNRVSTLLVDLAIAEPDLEMRLERLWASVRSGKRRFSRMSDDAIVAVTAMTLTPTFFGLALRARRNLAQYNVVISNVPGPKAPLFLAGAPLRHIFPVSIVADHLGLNITFTSCGDSLDIGIVACQRALPDMPAFIAQLSKAFAELEKFAEECSGSLVGSQLDAQPTSTGGADGKER